MCKKEELTRTERYKQLEEEYFREFKTLIGHTIVDIKRGNTGEITYVITLDNGVQITAEDGEYGDDAFSIIKDGLLYRGIRRR